jgi:hypothetical protein
MEGFGPAKVGVSRACKQAEEEEEALEAKGPRVVAGRFTLQGLW